MDAEISKRIWITRYLMIIGIMILHLPPYQPLSDLGGSWFDFIKAFFSHGIFRAAVPVLTAMSGFLVFNSGLYLHPKKLLVKKTSSILLPLIIWNIPIVIMVFFLQKYTLFSHDFSVKLYPINFLSWINAIAGVTDAPLNYPLNFLRDLFVISLLSPIFGLFLKKNPYIGLSIVLIIYYFNLDGQLILRNSMLVSFYMGALVACKNWDLKYLDKHAKILLTLFLIISICIVYYQWENRELFRIISPILIWPATSMLINSKIGDSIYAHSKASFFTFLSHAPIILAIWIIFNKITPELPYAVYWLFTPILTLVLTNWLYRVFKKTMPTISMFVLGGR